MRLCADTAQRFKFALSGITKLTHNPQERFENNNLIIFMMPYSQFYNFLVLKNKQNKEQLTVLDSSEVLPQAPGSHRDMDHPCL